MSIDQDLAKIARQEQELQFARLDEALAWDLGVIMRQMAVERSAPVVIEIRRFGQPLFFTALAGTTPDNVDWVRRKANVVARFLRSSYAMGLSLQKDSTTLQARFGLADVDYAAHGGSFPIVLATVGAIGSITVSGLPQREDHEFVVEALSGFLARDYSALALPPGDR